MTLRDDPTSISEHLWYYEEKKGITIVYEILDKNGKYMRTDQFMIPWKKLLESVNRKYEFKGKR